jgi:ABC-type lipoprotein release transport system permease subunit
MNKGDTGRFETTVVKGDGAIARWLSLFLMAGKGMISLQLQQVLTLLTMTIGSLALAATIFVGDGALLSLTEDLNRLVGNIVRVYPDAGPKRNLLKQRSTADLTLDDLTYVKRKVTNARYVVPVYFAVTRIEYHNVEYALPVDGIAREMESDMIYHPVSGSGFSEEGRRAMVWECLITESAARLFNIRLEERPSLRIGNQRFTIVGIVKDPPEADPRFETRIVIPFFAAQVLWGKPQTIDSIVVSWRDAKDMEPVIKALRNALDECRGHEAYYLDSAQFKIQKRKNILSNFRVFGSVQALFCILVASIGVINVMLSAVVRRSKEFAIRIAMGAKHLDIVVIVLSESFMFGFFGAILGIIAAVFSSPLICSLLASRVMGASQIQPYFSVEGMLIPLLACSQSGLLAGIIPALRARNLDILPILRAE